MKVRAFKIGTAAIFAGALMIAGCKTQGTAPASPGEVTAGTPSGGATGGSGSSIPTLVSVNLQNVLNNLSLSLQVDRNNVPVTAQVPIDVAASVCGVSVSALAASVANGHASCTATTTTPQLTQAVQQQMAVGGNVGGGSQTMGAPSGSTTNNMM